MKHYQTILLILLLGVFSARAQAVEASCGLITTADYPSGNKTLTDSVCSIDAGTVEGADIAANEASTTNTATLTLINSNITIAANGTLAAGAVILEGTGASAASITITASGASYNAGNGIWVDDGDADGWALAGFTLYSATASGRRRLGLMRSVSTADCGDASYSEANTGTYYVDSDGDGYGTGSPQTVCGGAGYSANNTDCHDTGTNASLVWRSRTCYIDTDDDNWTNGSKTCTNGTSCATATRASTGDSTTVVTYTAGDLQGTIGDGSDSNDAQACATGANPTGSCNECVTGAIADQSSSEDVFSECGALDCDGGATKYYSGWASNVCYYKADVSAANAVCDGAGACKTAAVQCAASTQGVSTGVTRTTCKTQVGCTGTTAGSLGNVASGSDTYNDCALATAVVLNSAQNKTCTTKCSEQASQQDGTCNGAGACATAVPSCVSVGKDASGSDGTVQTWNADTLCTTLSSKTCSYNVLNVGRTCESHTAFWTNCRCE